MKKHKDPKAIRTKEEFEILRPLPWETSKIAYFAEGHADRPTTDPR